MKNNKQNQRGLTYLEVLISTVLILIVLVPALDSIYSGIQGSQLHADQIQIQSRLISKMEQTLATPYSELVLQADAIGSATILIPPPYSDDLNTEFRRLVYLSRYDGDNADSDENHFTGTDEGLLWLQVKIEGRANTLETLIHE